MDRRTGSGRCCSMWESRLVSESITHHPNMTSPLGDSLCLAPTIYWKGTPRTCEINGAQSRTTEPMRLADWCTVQQETSIYGSLSCIGLYDLSGLATFRLIPSHWRSLYTVFFFTYNHYHYVRWVSVHLRDMMTLSHLHPHM